MNYTVKREDIKMAINQQAYSQYNNNKVLTASPAELTLLLYEGAIKFCNVAIIGVEQKDIMKVHNNLKKAQAIIEELAESSTILTIL